MKRDYVIIQRNGKPLVFNRELPSGNKEIVVYGDKYEAIDDFAYDDLCLLTIKSKENSNGTHHARMTDEVGRYIGEFNYDDNKEYDFQNKLWDFIVVYDFLSHSLPH